MNIRIPASWLREYLKTDIALKTIANHLSLAGPTIEKIQKVENDYLLDIEVTSNRIDAFSVFGLARETHAILKGNNLKSELVKPKGLNLVLEPDTASPLTLDVIIKNRSLCPRFTAIIIDNVKIKPSPAFIRNRLEKSGIRSINNIVDISNYIMLELGQPMHTFDFDKIKGGKMILRAAIEEEKIITLDGQTRKIPAGAIVIEDEKRLIDLCGIMGGANSQISKRTKRVVLFVQAYDPLTIRKTTQNLAFRTEAAARFEKGIDLEGIIPSLSRAAYLAKLTAGAKIASELVDIANYKKEQKPVILNLAKLASYLNVKIQPEKAARILGLLGFDVKTTAQTITAQAPSWRTNDVEDDVDLIEEIARIYGYHNLSSKLPKGQIPQEINISDLESVIDLKRALKFLGLTEVMTYSIISKDLLSLAQVGENEAVKLTNPLTDQWQFMRSTILISLAQIITSNQNLQKNMEIFEVAKTYQKKEGDLPKQDLTLAVALDNANFYQIKGIVENIFEILARDIKFQKLTGNNPLFEKENSAQVKIGDTVVGTLGILSSQVTDYFKNENPVAAVEINLSAVYSLPTTAKSFRPIPKYPSVIEDISAVFEVETALAEIVSAIKESGKPLVNKVEVIDVYQNEKIGTDKKSVTLRLSYQKSSGTPTQEKVTQIRNKVISSLEKTLKAKVRTST